MSTSRPLKLKLQLSARVPPSVRTPSAWPGTADANSNNSASAPSRRQPLRCSGPGQRQPPRSPVQKAQPAMGNPFEAMSQRRSLEEIEQQMQAYSRNLQQLKLRLDQAVTSSAWPAPSANPQPGDGKVLSFRKAERLTSAASPEPAAASGDTGATPFMEPTARSPSWSKEDAEVSEDLEETRRPVVAVRDDSGYLYSARRVYAPIGEHGLHGEQPPASRRAASEDIRSETGAVTAPHVRRLASSAQCRDSASPAPASGIIVRRASAAAPWGGASPAHAVAGRPVASRASGCVAPGAAYVCAPPQGQGATCSGSNPGCVTWVRAAPSPRTYGYQGRSTYAAPGHRRWGPRGAGPESLTAAAAAALVSPRTPRSRSPEPQARLLASSPPSPWQAQRSPRASWPREPSPPASPCPGVHRPCYPQSPEPPRPQHDGRGSPRRAPGEGSPECASEAVLQQRFCQAAKARCRACRRKHLLPP